MELLLPGVKVRGNESSSYHLCYSQYIYHQRKRYAATKKIEVNINYVNIGLLIESLTYGPNYVVSANTTNTFKNRLGNFWQSQDAVYDFKEQIRGTGSRTML